MQLTLALAFALCALLAPPASAASGDALSGTGAAVDERLSVVRAFFADHAVESRTDLLRAAELRIAMLAERSRLRARQWAARSQCRADVRKANRDAKLQTLLRCYRTELLQELALQEFPIDYLRSLTTLAPSIATTALAAHASFNDALRTMIAGMDAGVYDNDTDLFDAKKRLHSRYRIAAGNALLRARADALAGWPALITLRLQQMRKNAPDAFDPASWEAVLGCLEHQAELLATLGDEKEYEKIKDIYGQFQSTQLSCLGSVAALVPSAGTGWALPPREGE